MAKLRFAEDKGRCVVWYSGQCQPQPQYLEVNADGTCYFYVSSEIGWHCSPDVFHGRVQRLNIGHEYDMTHKMRREMFKVAKPLLQKVVDGMSERWNGNNYIGVLTNDAGKALEELAYMFSTDSWR